MNNQEIVNILRDAGERLRAGSYTATSTLALTGDLLTAIAHDVDLDGSASEQNGEVEDRNGRRTDLTAALTLARKVTSA